MNKREASALADTIALDLGDKAVELRPVGDRTQFVVVIHRQWFCFEFSDWHKYKTTVLEYPKQKVAV